MPVSDHELSARYSRQVILPEVGLSGQQALTAATVLIVGAGGLGSPAAMYLAAAGIGTLRIVDPDHVELSNLHRQLLHGDADIGLTKVASAAQALQALNTEIKIETVSQAVTIANLPSLLDGVQIVIDCSDNFATRFAVNQVCYTQQVPLVSGAAIRWQGQQVSFLYDRERVGCYQCLYDVDQHTQDNCSTAGIMPPVAGMVGCQQALAAIRILISSVNQACAPPKHAQLFCLDALTQNATDSWRVVTITPDPQCALCGE